MNSPKERILIVESDPETADIIGRQTLTPLGYRVEVVGAAAQAIQEAVRFAPDVILANLKLPGLSGKDLIVALTAQGVDIPMIVIAERGMEGEIIQAFRLGASDFLNAPIREAEVVTAVERVLRQVRSRRERESLARQLNQTNQELQRRVRELTTIFAIGKAVTSVTDQHALLDKICEGAAYVTEAEMGWLLLRDERNKVFILSAHKNLPKTIAARMNQPWDDGLSSLVALSGESLSISGEPLKRFKVSQLGQSALVVPIKVKSEVIGLIVVVRKSPQPFGSSNQAMLEALADYASISLVNARLFRALEERARSMQQTAEMAILGEHILNDFLLEASQELQDPLIALRGNTNKLLGKEFGKLNAEQSNAVGAVKDRTKNIGDIADAMAAVPSGDGAAKKPATDINELVRQAIARFQPVAQQNGLSLIAELTPKPVFITESPSHISRVIEGLLSNAIRFSPAGKQVTLRVETTPENQIHILFRDKGIGIDARHIPHLFEPNYRIDAGPARRFGGLGISLPLIREIITAHGGKIWVESKPGEGSTFHFSLPSANPS